MEETDIIMDFSDKQITIKINATFDTNQQEFYITADDGTPIASDDLQNLIK